MTVRTGRPDGTIRGVRRPFAHEFVLVLAPGGDERAPGAAITAALCGHWDHPPPCPLASHHTAIANEHGTLRLRTLFATEPDRADEVRARMTTALAAGHLPVAHPPGEPAAATPRTRWRLVTGRPSEVRPDEAEHARRLVAG
ncbi:hypothetical protein FRAAL3577 [Frankia alni ACN14a]|uniref:Uncharacterized protein n=1 Tax=Frankia alni (strain DSM 45986 / CECT 9034 / ACN14a) TaxID=326424 RepID=Q0RJU0_FRAAA|nr:hypothetical protein FRAAL3577 [Frankia alni ACN14a]